jgi:hypothetical protein
MNDEDDGSGLRFNAVVGKYLQIADVACNFI